MYEFGRQACGHQFASLGIRPAGITISIWESALPVGIRLSLGQDFGAEFSRGHTQSIMLVSVQMESG